MKVNLAKGVKKFSLKERGEKAIANKVIGHADFLFIFKFKDGKGKILEISWKIAITTIAIILNAIVIILIVKLLS